jgi:hypothetical protein
MGTRTIEEGSWKKSMQELGGTMDMASRNVLKIKSVNNLFLSVCLPVLV